MRLINEAKYDIRTLQLRLLPVLECIDKVCREHHLRYYLCAGTMLGAVRHRGFIPWDDDVDVCMPRPDYEQLMIHCSEWLPEPMEIISPHNRPDYPYPLLKSSIAALLYSNVPIFCFLKESISISFRLTVSRRMLNSSANISRLISSGVICCSCVVVTPSSMGMVLALGGPCCCIRYSR